jgi:hypothetical protein
MEIGIELFLATHDQFLSLLDQAYLTGDTSGLLPLLGPDYHGYFGTRREDRASFYDRQRRSSRSKKKISEILQIPLTRPDRDESN